MIPKPSDLDLPTAAPLGLRLEIQIGINERLWIENRHYRRLLAGSVAVNAVLLLALAWAVVTLLGGDGGQP